MPEIPLATPAQLESATQGRIKATDDWVPEALAAASQAIRNECGWHIAPPREETVTMDGRGGRILFLPSLHVTDISSITAAGAALVEANDDFEWSYNGIVERGLSSSTYDYVTWPRKRRSVTVTFEHGHNLDEVPEVIGLCCTIAARTIVALMARGAVGESAGSNNVQLGRADDVAAATTVLPHERRTLKPYILPERA